MLGGTLYDPLSSPVIDPRRLGGSVYRRAITAINCLPAPRSTVTTGCVVTPDAISSEARTASTCIASLCAELIAGDELDLRRRGGTSRVSFSDGYHPPPRSAVGRPVGRRHRPPLGGLEARRPFPARLGPKGNLVYKLVTTTDHKTIGIMYVVTCFAFFFIGGLMALLMRAELATPGLQFLSNEQFNQLFTMHGTIMLLLRMPPRSCSGSPTWCCRCRSARLMWRFRD